MKIGVVFPQTEIGADPDVVAEYAVTAESLGYDHLLAYDHVLGAGTATRPEWKGPYSSESMFQEPLVLFSYLAALTASIELVTAVIILPQRQTALVAKQAACVDVLSRGRLRLGIGTGWNEVEYEALGENFHNRGQRSEEQIDLLRKLWQDDVISYAGEHHTITEAGLNPLPTHRDMPIWLGGMAPQVIERVGRLADGWFPFVNRDLEKQIQQVRASARAAGRDPDSIGIECIMASNSSIDDIKRLQDMGITHVAMVTMNQGLAGPVAHMDAIKQAREMLSKL